MTPNSKALIRSTVGVIWLVVALTIATELSAPFKALLENFASHHWVGKSIISAVAFIVFYLLFRKSNESGSVLGSVLWVVGSVILGGLIIFSFYLWHFLNG